MNKLNISKENIKGIKPKEFFGFISRKYGNIQEIEFKGYNAFIYY